jgi:hypothetical protein
MLFLHEQFSKIQNLNAMVEYPRILTQYILQTLPIGIYLYCHIFIYFGMLLIECYQVFLLTENRFAVF